MASHTIMRNIQRVALNKHDEVAIAFVVSSQEPGSSAVAVTSFDGRTDPHHSFVIEHRGGTARMVLSGRVAVSFSSTNHTLFDKRSKKVRSEM